MSATVIRPILVLGAALATVTALRVPSTAGAVQFAAVSAVQARTSR